MILRQLMLGAIVAPGLLILSCASTSQALAGGPAPSAQTACPSHTVCDTTLGVALTPTAGWLRLPAARFPPHTLAFGTRPASGLDYDLRLQIAPYAITSVRSDVQAASLVARKLIASERVASATQTRVRYDGSPGILIHGLPGGPGPATDIVLARHNQVYLIIAPGTSLARDQRRALATLRFIPRTGPFLPPVGGG